jgi:TfoX/Sxy family transcriptional regulator of competence genes
MSTAPDSPLTAVVDEVLTSWPEVKARPVFGHRGYVRGGKMFAFLADGGIAVKATGTFADELYARPGVAAFAHTGMPMRQWPILPLPSDDVLDEVLGFARRSYESAV